MLQVTLASGQVRQVSSGAVDMPLTGIWMADCKLITQPSDETPSGHVVLTLGESLMPGTVAVAELVEGLTHLRVVGGRGGLGNSLKPKHYYRPTVRHLLVDWARDTGETLSPTCTAATLATQLEAWTTLSLPAGAQLAALCAVLGGGTNWRVLADGTLWVGVETWPASDAAYRSIETDGAGGTRVIGTDGPVVRPGTTLDGRKIDSVVHDIDGNRTRITWAEVA
jgi:hypothetical protein